MLTRKTNTNKTANNGNGHTDVEDAKKSVMEAFDVMGGALSSVRLTLAKDEAHNKTAVSVLGRIAALMRSTKDLTEAVFDHYGTSNGMGRKTAALREMSSYVRCRL